MNDIELGQIEDKKDFDFKKKYDEDREIYDDQLHNCDYFEFSEFKNKFKDANSFSCYSHNIRSITGHWDDNLDIIGSVKPIKFSVLAFQEIWSVSRVYDGENCC